MNRFKVGDKVKCVDGGTHISLTLNKCYIIKNLRTATVQVENDSGVFEWYYDLRFEPLEEDNVFDLKKNDWFIRTPTPEIAEIVQIWLFEQGVGWQFPVGEKVVHHDVGNFLMSSAYNKSCFCHSSLIDPKHDPHKEIKLTFKTVVDSVEYPVVESEQEIKIRELKETIDKAQKQIDVIINNKN